MARLQKPLDARRTDWMCECYENLRRFASHGKSSNDQWNDHAAPAERSFGGSFFVEVMTGGLHVEWYASFEPRVLGLAVARGVMLPWTNPAFMPPPSGLKPCSSTSTPG
jgi:hypothetical protein